MTIDQETTERIYHWCIDKYGFSKYQPDYPYLNVSNRNAKAYGCFESWTNTIKIYLKNHNHILDLINTVIHEFVHYHQSPTWLTRYSDTTDYSDNPYEYEANQVSYRDQWECYQDLKRG